MTRPWKHPDSGYYWFRKRVPDDLRNLIGKREERFSLGTRDPTEAKRLHAEKAISVLMVASIACIPVETGGIDFVGLSRPILPPTS
jgi:hypothetical protein